MAEWEEEEGCDEEVIHPCTPSSLISRQSLFGLQATHGYEGGKGEGMARERAEVDSIKAQSRNMAISTYDRSANLRSR